MKYSFCILGGICTEDYLYMTFIGNRILQIERETGIAIDIIELEKEIKPVQKYINIFCQNKKIFMCPFQGGELTVYENGNVFNYDLGFGGDVQILAVALVQDEFIMLSQKTEGFLSFNIKTHKLSEMKIEDGFCERPTMDKMNDVFWIIDRKGQVIENDQGKISILYRGDQKLKKYYRDYTGEYFICLNGEVWKRSGNKTKQLAVIPDIANADIGCYGMDGILYIVYLDRNLIYIISEGLFRKLAEDDCKYWIDEEGSLIVPTIMPDKYHGGIYLYTNYQHKIIYLGLCGEVIENPIYIRKQKLELFTQEIRSDDLQSYLEASDYSKKQAISTLADWIKKI